MHFSLLNIDILFINLRPGNNNITISGVARNYLREGGEGLVTLFFCSPFKYIVQEW